MGKHHKDSKKTTVAEEEPVGIKETKGVQGHQRQEGEEGQEEG